MAISLLFGRKHGAVIGSLILDATISEVYDYKNDVAQDPVEDGSSITDNIKKNPEVYTVNGFVTNTPASLFQAKNIDGTNTQDKFFNFKDLERSAKRNAIELAHDTLLAISGRKVNGEEIEPSLIKIVADLRVYDNMAMTSLSIPRDARTGETLRFSATFIRIHTTKTETVDIPNAKIEKAQSTVDVNKQTTTAATDTKKAKVSAAKRGAYKLGLFN